MQFVNFNIAVSPASESVLKIRSFVHVTNYPFNRNKPNGPSEEEFFNGCRGNCLQRWQQQQQLAEAEGLRGMCRADVLAECQLSVILQSGDGAGVA